VGEGGCDSLPDVFAALRIRHEVKGRLTGRREVGPLEKNSREGRAMARPPQKIRERCGVGSKSRIGCERVLDGALSQRQQFLNGRLIEIRP
jgi:hypothetical protein